MRKSSVYFSTFPHFRLVPFHLVCSGDGSDLYLSQAQSQSSVTGGGTNNFFGGHKIILPSNSGTKTKKKVIITNYTAWFRPVAETQFSRGRSRSSPWGHDRIPRCGSRFLPTDSGMKTTTQKF